MKLAQRILMLGQILADSPQWTLADTDAQIWVDAYDDETLAFDTGKVSAWYDKSGYDRHLTQSTSSLQPAQVSYGIVFDSDWFQVPLAAFPTVGYTLIAVMKSSSTGAASCGFINIDSDPTDDPSIRIGIGDNIANYMNGAYTANLNASCNTLGIVAVGNATGIISTVHRNGTQIATATVAGSLSPINQFTIGYYNRLSGNRNGTLYELAVIPNDDRQMAEGYLAHKWDSVLGITTLVTELPESHPYKTSPPAP